MAVQPQLFVNKNMSEDIYAFEDALRFSVDTPPKNEDGEKLFSIKVIQDGRLEGVMAGMVAKAKSLHGHDAEFNEFSVEDYPPMVWFWDREQQVLLVEKKTNVFSSATAAGKAFQRVVNNIELAEIGLRADIEPVLNSEDNSFWDEYDKFDFVQTVSFELVPPNLFGSTEKEMKEALSETAQDTNANRITATFENKDSKLNLRSDGWLSNMVRWCRKGGGNWVLKGRLSGHTKRLTNVKSERTAKIVSMAGKGITEVTLEGYQAEDIAQILQLYRPEYEY